MTDVIYCDGCGQYRRSEYQIDMDDEERIFEQKCTTCSGIAEQHIIHLDEGSDKPSIYSFTSGEDLQMYDTDILVQDDSESLKKKSRILREGTRLLKKWTEEDKKKEEEQKKFERLEKLSKLLQEKNQLEKELEPLAFGVDARHAQSMILDSIERVHRPLLDSKTYYLISTEYLDAIKKNISEQNSKFVEFGERLNKVKAELNSLMEAKDGK